MQMDAWNEHEVTFSPAEGLERNETSVRVLDQGASPEAQRTEQADRMLGHGASGDTIREFQDGIEMEAKIREDPGYKFLMLVSAFSARRLGKLVSSTGNEANGHRFRCGAELEIFGGRIHPSAGGNFWEGKKLCAPADFDDKYHIIPS